MRFPFGTRVECRFSGFRGSVVAAVQMINGSVQYAVQPHKGRPKADDDGDSGYCPDAMNIDEASLMPEPETYPTKEQLRALEANAPTLSFELETGDRVRSRINGFEGVVRSRIYYANGCTRYVVEGKVDKDGKRVEMGGFAQEWAKVDEGLNAPDEEPVRRARTGGPSTKFERPE